MGVSILLGAWQRGRAENRLRVEGFHNPAPIRRKQDNCQVDLWGVLMFQAWLESQFSRADA